MTFKKIHRRADLPQYKRQINLGGTSTTASHSTSAAGGNGPNMPIPGAASSTPASASTTAHSTTSTTSTSSSSSSSVATSTTVPTTPPAGNTVTTPRVSSYVPASRTTVTQRASTTSHAATATTTSDDSGMGLGSIAGIAVAAIVGIGVITAFVIWLIKRRNKNRDIDEEPFNRHSWMRNSTAIPDDDDDRPLPSRVRPTPPAPSMTERQPTPLYGQQAFGADPNGFNYATQPSYNAVPGQVYGANAFGPGGAPATPLPHSPGFGNTYDQQGFNNGGYQELTRGPGMHDYPPSPARGFDPHFDNPHSPSYAGHESFPMPPSNGGAQFDERGQDIHHRSMTPAQHGQVVSVANSVHDGRETPVQLGFAPGPHGPAHGPNGGAPAPAHGRAPGQRPETVYDTDDAYGGI